MDRLVLEHRDSVVGFEFSATDFTQPEKINFVTEWLASMMIGSMP